MFWSSCFVPAKEKYQKSLEAYSAAGDLRGSALLLIRLGWAFEYLGEFDQARQAFQKSLSFFEKSADSSGMARAKAQLGSLNWATGHYQESSNLLQEALSLYHAAKDGAGEAFVDDLMGNLRLAMREDVEAERHYRTAYDWVQKNSPNSQAEAWNHFHMGMVFQFRQRMEEAETRFIEALKIFTKLKDGIGQISTLTHLGEIACEMGIADEAEKYLLKAIQLVLPTRSKPLLTDALAAVAQLLKLKGDERKAVSILMVALSHPTCRQQTKDRMVNLVMKLQSTFTAKEAEAGFQWAKEVRIEDVAAAWTSSHTVKPKKKQKS